MKNIFLIISLLCLLSCCSDPPEPMWENAIFIMNDDGSNVTHLIDDSPENVQFTLDDEKIIINRLGGGDLVYEY